MYTFEPCVPRPEHISVHGSAQPDTAQDQSTYEDENHARGQEHHNQGQHTEISTAEPHTDQNIAADQHSRTTVDQPTLHNMWRPNLCTKDLDNRRNDILVHGPSDQGPRTLLMIHTGL